MQPPLGYTQWRRFEQAIERAVTSCESSGNNRANHFAGAGKMIALDKGGSAKSMPEPLNRDQRPRFSGF